MGSILGTKAEHRPKHQHSKNETNRDDNMIMCELISEVFTFELFFKIHINAVDSTVQATDVLSNMLTYNYNKNCETL